MNRKSLLSQITIFFVFLMVVINTLFYFQAKLQKEQLKNSYMRKSHEARGLLHRARKDFLGLEATNAQLKEILGLERLKDIDTSGMEFVLAHRTLKVYRDGEMIYFVLNHHHPLILRYHDTNSSSNLILFILLINGAIFIFYIYVMRRLTPLRELKDRIIDFANGKVVIMPPLKGGDEIAQLSDEFNKSITKIDALQESRKLFLRNIMHELNTPIAKGKLISDLLDDTKNRDRLQKIFSRFEYLLGEFSKIERVTSNVMLLDKKNYRAVDLVDNALDLLLVERNEIDIEVLASLDIHADFELFSIALKNLIDNAIKYGEGRAKVLIESSILSIESVGDEIENLSFETIFNRAFEDSSKGLGLGLYITYNILKKHNYNITYQFANNINRFVIQI